MKIITEKYWLNHREDFFPTVYDKKTFIPTVKRKLDGAIFVFKKNN